ncbi:hypothetical protein A2U01_0023257 [Trifolium medium]|uniref:Uncharacterized protein n=1 Tax=Trifolium medium TaxID=97028 RepID=A0A392NUR5_9FABA|nr:hypothetical protein [Trifolium medium]
MGEESIMGDEGKGLSVGQGKGAEGGGCGLEEGK